MNNKYLISFGQSVLNKTANSFVRLNQTNELGFFENKRGAGGDETKKGDVLIEKSILSEIKNEFGKNSYVVVASEELGVIEIGNKHKLKDGIFIILDPLDGSNNLRPWKTPSPVLAISMAFGYIKNLSNDNFDSIEVGLVKEIFHGELFSAIKNQGAWLNNDYRLKSSKQTQIKGSIIGTSMDCTGTKFDIRLQKLLPILREKSCQRRLGSTILDLAMVATGNYDAYISINSRCRIHDLSAISLIIKEAGANIHFDVFGNDGNKNFLESLILKKDRSILSKITFDVLAAGTEELFYSINKLL